MENTGTLSTAALGISWYVMPVLYGLTSTGFLLFKRS